MSVREPDLPHPESEVARVFFALWPGNLVRSDLHQLSLLCHQSCGGRRTRRENIHQTLVFLGDVELHRLEVLQRIGAEVAAARFTLTLDVLGYWKHNRVVWAGATRTPPSLDALVQNLEQHLDEAGFHFEHRPYVPHITLLRKALCREGAPPLTRPVRWDAEDFVLVRSVRGEDGSSYDIIGRWRLQD